MLGSVSGSPVVSSSSIGEKYLRTHSPLHAAVSQPENHTEVIPAEIVGSRGSSLTPGELQFVLGGGRSYDSSTGEWSVVPRWSGERRNNFLLSVVRHNDSIKRTSNISKLLYSRFR